MMGEQWFMFKGGAICIVRRDSDSGILMTSEIGTPGAKLFFIIRNNHEHQNLILMNDVIYIAISDWNYRPDKLVLRNGFRLGKTFQDTDGSIRKRFNIAIADYVAYLEGG